MSNWRGPFVDKEIFRASYFHVAEPPPTPMEMLRSVGVMAAMVVYMVAIICLIVFVSRALL